MDRIQGGFVIKDVDCICFDINADQANATLATRPSATRLIFLDFIDRRWKREIHLTTTTAAVDGYASSTVTTFADHHAVIVIHIFAGHEESQGGRGRIGGRTCESACRQSGRIDSRSRTAIFASPTSGCTRPDDAACTTASSGRCVELSSAFFRAEMVACAATATTVVPGKRTAIAPAEVVGRPRRRLLQRRHGRPRFRRGRKPTYRAISTDAATCSPPTDSQ